MWLLCRGGQYHRLRQGWCKAQQALEVVLLSRLQRPQVTLLVLQQEGVQLICRRDRGQRLPPPLLYFGHSLGRAMLQNNRTCCLMSFRAQVCPTLDLPIGPSVSYHSSDTVTFSHGDTQICGTHSGEVLQTGKLFWEVRLWLVPL